MKAIDVDWLHHAGRRARGLRRRLFGFVAHQHHQWKFRLDRAKGREKRGSVVSFHFPIQHTDAKFPQRTERLQVIWSLHAARFHRTITQPECEQAPVAIFVSNQKKFKRLGDCGFAHWHPVAGNNRWRWQDEL
ncbi:hypothetical protein K0B96_04150 [Horticoccus luteus]|uniref:Uncharacterized protein n=1 Tax=Horticoccus luteus TaxID=2862869 RepID=A0A8F9TX99_9BACT|nr:hypothetical protein [Horticoccus luteus]QYM79820.1 hypothetical protein K0B96_04150 [Horticoccus luteus]